MRIVIQNKVTRLFWKKKSEWAADSNEAHDFEMATDAEKFCRDSQLEQIQIVVKFESLEDVVL